MSKLLTASLRQCARHGSFGVMARHKLKTSSDRQTSAEGKPSPGAVCMKLCDHPCARMSCTHEPWLRVPARCEVKFAFRLPTKLGSILVQCESHEACATEIFLCACDVYHVGLRLSCCCWRALLAGACSCLHRGPLMQHRWRLGGEVGLT